MGFGARDIVGATYRERLGIAREGQHCEQGSSRYGRDATAPTSRKPVTVFIGRGFQQKERGVHGFGVGIGKRDGATA